MHEVGVSPDRLRRWVENFERRHGPVAAAPSAGAYRGRAEDGSTFVVRLPFGATYAGGEGPDPLDDLVAEARRLPSAWGVLLVRKGGFAVARLAGPELVEHKIGQRHVQGRTKAGGQSQQRFARRRDNQARQAYEAAADHAARILGGLTGPVIAGGDHAAVEAVLTDPRLRDLAVVGPWLAVPDPRRAVLDRAVEEAGRLRIEVVNADEPA